MSLLSPALETVSIQNLQQTLIVQIDLRKWSYRVSVRAFTMVCFSWRKAKVNFIIRLMYNACYTTNLYYLYYKSKPLWMLLFFACVKSCLKWKHGNRPLTIAYCKVLVVFSRSMNLFTCVSYLSVWYLFTYACTTHILAV